MELEFPKHMVDLKPARMMQCNTLFGGSVWVNGKKMKKKFLSSDVVGAMKVSNGVQCGLIHVHVSVPRLNLIGQKYIASQNFSIGIKFYLNCLSSQ